MSADSPRRSSGGTTRGMMAVPAIVPPQVVSDRSILDSAIGFINEVTLAHQPLTDPKDTITWARFETAADISDPRFGEDWELEGNVAPPLLLILGYGLGVQVWAIPANGEAVEVLSWRHGIVSALRVLPTPSSSVAVEENGRADEPIDAFVEKRPLIALVDGSSSSGSQPQFCAVNFISLKTGTQIKTIKFKNPVVDILANRSSIVITFHERIAVFDVRTLDDRLSITTCYPSPGINPNPVALGPRWLAYAEHKLLHSKRSGGGCDGDGVASYTATVLNASKSLVKGLRELGEQVAAGLTGTSGSAGSSKNTSFDSGMGPDSKQSGIVTIVDVKNPLRDYSPTTGVPMSSNQTAGTDPIIAHFIAHPEALVAMEFDNSGMLLVTADRRGHDFHVFRIQPNPVGPSLAAVHHLYVLHRGDTSAKVQNISLSLDSRWVAVSTLRGTTHVFPITPYGGPMGVRTHTSLHVVNKLSRFHRSAGLSAEGRSNSPISHSESTTFSQSLQPYHNPTLPPFHRPTVVLPLAQLRQPFALGSPPGSATLAGVKSVTGGGSGSGSQRQRLSSLSDDSGKPLSVCAIFAKSRSWLLDPPNVTREAPHRMQRKAVDSLFVMAGHGALIQYDLDTKLAPNVAKEKICDDTPIELEVEAKAQWNLGRRKEGSQEIMPPLMPDNWLIKNRNSCMLTDSTRQYDDSDDRGESWLAQVEIVTHAGPHRRLWMGPQFVFKTYNTPSGSNLSHVDIEAVEIGTAKTSTATTTTTTKPEHSSPLNMPLTSAGRSSAVPVLIESGSYSSIEQSPKLMDRFRHDHLDSDYSVAHGDSRLKEDLADAMRESPSVAAAKESGRVCDTGNVCGGSGDNVAFYDALTDHDDHEDQDYVHARTASAAALASALPNIHSYDNSSSYESFDSLKKPKASIEKIVNPLGTVTTITSCLTADVKTDILDEVVSQLAAEDTIIHENCDESLFRPVVTIFCDEKTRLKNEEEARKNQEHCQPPEAISNKLVVPVIAKEVDDELNKKEKEKNSASKAKVIIAGKELENLAKEKSKFEELSSLNKKSRGAIAKVEHQKKDAVMNVKDMTKISDDIVKEKQIICQESKTPIVKECKKKTAQGDKSSEVNTIGKIIKTTKTATEKRPPQEKENTHPSSKEEINTQEAKMKKINEFDEEKPIEFIRMTPKIAEKATPSKTLPKKEIKKLQKTKEESVELRSDIENVKNIEYKSETETLAVKEIKLTQESLEKKSTKATHKISEEKFEVIKKTPNENIKEDSEKEIPKKDTVIKSSSSKANTDLAKSTNVVTSKKEEIKSDQIRKEPEDKEKALEFTQITASSSLETKSNTETTAFNVKLSAIDKTALKDEIKTASRKNTLPTKKQGVVKTEQLNVKDLADSLIELKDQDDEKEKSKIDTEKEQIAEKQEKKTKATTPLLETVDIFTASPKVSKKNKKKGNKSGSSSENEEIVEATKTSKTKIKPSQSEDKSILKKKASTSSEDSNTDWADTLLERKDALEETMFVSFTQTEERKTFKDPGKFEEKTKITTKECDKKSDSNEPSDIQKNVEAKRETTAIRSKESIEMKQEENVIKSKEKKSLEKLETKPETNIESKKSEEVEFINDNKKPLESASYKKSLKDDKFELHQKNKVAKEKSNSEKLDEKIVPLKTYLKKPASDEIAVGTDTEKDADLTCSREEQVINKSVEIKGNEIKSIDKENEKHKKGQVIKTGTKVEDKKESDAKMEANTEKDQEKYMKSCTKKQEQPAAKEKQSKVEDRNKDDKKSIVVEKQEPKETKRIVIKVDDTRNDSNPKTDQNPLQEKQNEQQHQEDTKANVSYTKDKKLISKESPKKESFVKKHEIIASIKEINRNKITPPLSPKKKGTEDAATATKEPKKSPGFLEEPKQTQSVTLLKEDNKKEELLKNSAKKFATEEDTSRVKGNLKEGVVSTDSVDTSEIAKHGMSKKLNDKTQTPNVLPPPVSAWKTLSGAEMISKNLYKVDTDTVKFPSLGAISKSITSKNSTNAEKLLPELPTPKEMSEPLCLGKIGKKTKKPSTLDEFSILKPLGSLPPLPVLEPLELVTETRSSNLKDFSLINFESPLQENPALQRKITPPARGFTEQNLIFALCGSLHYENEHARASPEKADLSPTLSSNRSSSALDEPSMADYKSLTENDELYISLEQSSQDTNTTNTNTTNEKFSSSTNSSGSEEIIIMEEKKMTKKQKRKRQQQLQELQKQKEQQQQHQEMDDEELRPLIAMTESQIDQIPSGSDANLPTLMDASFSMKPLTTTHPLTHSTTTDSEGPMPATTSDDNVFTIPAHPVAHTQHKIKTKKLEHKINLIAAIEAATSSSTSSAEESGAELEGPRSLHDNDESSLISVANIVAATSLPLPIVVAPQTTVGALKKKTKRRKR